jgi:hypothetical protein
VLTDRNTAVIAKCSRPREKRKPPSGKSAILGIAFDTDGLIALGRNIAASSLRCYGVRHAHYGAPDCICTAYSQFPRGKRVCRDGRLI